MVRRAYSPARSTSRLRWDGDWQAARSFYLERRPANLHYLLERRYRWMSPYLEGKRHIVEVGSGAGYASQLLGDRVLLTDVAAHPWHDAAVDGLQMPFRDRSIDALICAHTLHHLARPMQFFAEARRVLGDGGFLLIQELHTSPLLRLLFRVLRHEGWDDQVDVFDARRAAIDVREPLSANCAIPQLLFADSAVFEQRVPGFEVVRNELCELFLWLASGGVNAKVRTVPLPSWGLRLLDRLDRALIALLPTTLALGRRVALCRVEGR